MPTIWTYVRAGAVLVGSSAALLTGGIAHADPAPAPDLGPANIAQQLISSAANAPQILQNFATALGATPPVSAPRTSEPGLMTVPGISGLTPAAPAAVPAAPPSIPGVNTPIPGITAPGPAAPAAPTIPWVPVTIPGVTPAAPAAAPASVPGLVPTAKVDLPSLPYLPVQVPQQVSLPGDIPALAAGAIPGGQPQPTAPIPAALNAPSTLLGALP